MGVKRIEQALYSGAKWLDNGAMGTDWKKKFDLNIRKYFEVFADRALGQATY